MPCGVKFLKGLYFPTIEFKYANRGLTKALKPHGPGLTFLKEEIFCLMALFSRLVMEKV